MADPVIRLSKRFKGGLNRLGRDRRGQALVETIFAMTVLVLLILVTAQLFLISDAAIYSLVGAHRQATQDSRNLDGRHKFEFLQIKVTTEVETLPGLNWALRHFDETGVAEKWIVPREMAVFGGAYTGEDYSVLGLYFPAVANSLLKGRPGRRVIDVGKAIGQSLFKP